MPDSWRCSRVILCSIPVRIKELHKILVSKYTSYIHRKPVILFPWPHFHSAPKPMDSHTQSVARRSKVAMSFLIHCMDKANVHNTDFQCTSFNYLLTSIYNRLATIDRSSHMFRSLTRDPQIHEVRRLLKCLQRHWSNNNNFRWRLTSSLFMLSWEVWSLAEEIANG